MGETRSVLTLFGDEGLFGSSVNGEEVHGGDPVCPYLIQ